MFTYSLTRTWEPRSCVNRRRSWALTQAESYSPLHQLFSTVGSADTASVTVFPVCTGWFPTTLTSTVLVEVFSLAFDGWSSWDEHYWHRSLSHSLHWSAWDEHYWHRSLSHSLHWSAWDEHYWHRSLSHSLHWSAWDEHYWHRSLSHSLHLGALRTNITDIVPCPPSSPVPNKINRTKFLWKLSPIFRSVLSRQNHSDNDAEFNVLGCRVDLLGTNCEQCVCMVQCCFTSTETIRFIRTGSPGRPPRLSRSSWTL